MNLKELANLIEHRGLEGLNGIAFDLGTRHIDIQAEIVKALRAARPEALPIEKLPRYDIYCIHGDEWEWSPSADGEWVKWSELQALLSPQQRSALNPAAAWPFQEKKS